MLDILCYKIEKVARFSVQVAVKISGTIALGVSDHRNFPEKDHKWIIRILPLLILR